MMHSCAREVVDTFGGACVCLSPAFVLGEWRQWFLKLHPTKLCFGKNSTCQVLIWVKEMPLDQVLQIEVMFWRHYNRVFLTPESVGVCMCYHLNYQSLVNSVHLFNTMCRIWAHLSQICEIIPVFAVSQNAQHVAILRTHWNDVTFIQICSWAAKQTLYRSLSNTITLCLKSCMKFKV